MRVTRLDFPVPIVCIDGFLDPADASRVLREATALEKFYSPARVPVGEGNPTARSEYGVHDVVCLSGLFGDDPGRSDVLRLIKAKLASPECHKLWSTGGLIFEIINCATFCEGFLSRYGPGGCSGDHTDTRDGEPASHITTLVYYASQQPQHFTGGNLTFWADGESLAVEPRHNRAVVFPSSTSHGVEAVTMESTQWEHGYFSLTYHMGFQ